MLSSQQVVSFDQVVAYLGNYTFSPATGQSTGIGTVTLQDAGTYLISYIVSTPTNSSAGGGLILEALGIESYPSSASLSAISGATLSGQAVVTATANTSVALVALGNLSTAGGNAELSTESLTISRLAATTGTQTFVPPPPAINGTLQALAFASPSPSFAPDQTVVTNVTGTLSNGTQIDVTENLVWSSSNAIVMQVSNSPGTRGQLYALTSGTSVITATDPVSGLNVSTTARALALSQTGAMSTVAAVVKMASSADGRLLYGCFRTGLAVVDSGTNFIVN